MGEEEKPTETLNDNFIHQKRKFEVVEEEENLQQNFLDGLDYNDNNNNNGDLYNDIQDKRQSVYDKKNIATAVWYNSLSLAEITAMRGNFWKCTGFSMNSKNFLYPEEVLYLVEKNLISIYDENNNFIDFDKFYEMIMNIITLPCYLSYSKLKSLEYVVMRHNKRPMKCFDNESDIVSRIKQNLNDSLLECLVSFDIYRNTKNFSKKNAVESPPYSHVVIVNNEYLFSGNILVKLLEEADEVPIIVAAVMSNSNVILEEFTDAIKSLNWDNVVALPCL